MMWRQTVEPYATAWRYMAETARVRGLVHGMAALDHLPGNHGPACVADLLADMVRSGALEPLRFCAAGPHMHSVLAFRSLQGGAAGRTPHEWSPTDAHLFTYRVPRDA